MSNVTDTWHGSFSNLCEGLSLVIEKGFDEMYEPGYDWLPGVIEGNRAWACGAPLPSREANRVVAKYKVAFLKAHLVGEPGYQSLLTPGAALKSSPKVEFFAEGHGEIRAHHHRLGPEPVRQSRGKLAEPACGLTPSPAQSALPHSP